MKKSDSNFNEIPEYDYLKPASTQDCTGLIPFGLTNEEELEAYEELYSFLPPTYSKHSGSGEEI